VRWVEDVSRNICARRRCSESLKNDGRESKLLHNWGGLFVNKTNRAWSRVVVDIKTPWKRYLGKVKQRKKESRV
jgi:hypothetical protein